MQPRTATTSIQLRNIIRRNGCQRQRRHQGAATADELVLIILHRHRPSEIEEKVDRHNEGPARKLGGQVSAGWEELGLCRGGVPFLPLEVGGSAGPRESKQVAAGVGEELFARSQRKVRPKTCPEQVFHLSVAAS